MASIMDAEHHGISGPPGTQPSRDIRYAASHNAGSVQSVVASDHSRLGRQDLEAPRHTVGPLKSGSWIPMENAIVFGSLNTS